MTVPTAQAAPKTTLSKQLEQSARAVDKNTKISPQVLASKNKVQTVFVQLKGSGAADVASQARSQGRSTSSAAGVAKVRRSQVRTLAQTVAGQARRVDSSARQLFTTTNSVPGFGITATTKALTDIAQRSDVAKITAIVPRTAENAASGDLIKALATWQQTGNTGKGVKIGVIDTGIDYTHADFGGAGTVAAYEAAHATADSGAPWKPTAKVAGGYDFVGDDYNADPTAASYQPIPHPDPNPLDCGGHGTHVAGTAAGYGVTADGKTFTSSYKSLTSSTLRSMEIGPGMAPEASLYALRVFGCEGSTNMTIPAMDWALDPNGDGNFSDHLDIVNLSLGSDFGTADDPENAVVDNLAKHGVLPVFASGNAGDITDIGGSSGNAPRALTVASSKDDFNLLDGIKVDAPSDVVGTYPGQVSVAYPWATKPPVTGTVTPLSSANADGCTALTATDAAAVAGKVAWLVWDDNDATRRCGSAVRSANVAAAGAIGALFTSTLNEFAAGITGSATIPVFQMTASTTQKLQSAAVAGTLVVTFDGSLVGTVPLSNPAIVDTLSDFSSRNDHGAAPGVVKPDVTAPGETIISAAVGSGNGRSNLSGTSMATPHIAGVAALVKKQHPTWTVEQIKAAIMNTAVHDIYTGDNKTGDVYGPNRVGAGRTDARYAVATDVLAYSKSQPGVVSASFGVVEAPITSAKLSKTQQITVLNTASASRTVALSYSAVVKSPGVSYTVSPSSLTLGAGKSGTATVTMTVVPSALRHTIDPTMSTTTSDPLLGEGARQYVSDASGRLLVTPKGQTPLRVPVYGAAKPVSATSVVVSQAGGQRVFKVNGTGIDQGSGETGIQSTGWAMTLGVSSPKLATCILGQLSPCVLNKTASGVDLQYAGLGSLPADDFGYFGFSTWANWTTLAAGGREVDFEVDTNGDGKVDRTVLYYATKTDQPVSLVLDAEGNPVEAYGVNLDSGLTDTNTYDTNTAVLPFTLSGLGVDRTKSSIPIRYRVATFSGYYSNQPNGLVDSTGWVSADLAKPAVRPAVPLFPDVKGTTVPVTVGRTAVPITGSTGDVTAAQALVLHLHGASGQRAQVLTVR